MAPPNRIHMMKTSLSNLALAALTVVGALGASGIAKGKAAVASLGKKAGLAADAAKVIDGEGIELTD
jgi:hypothetical protein